MSPPFRAAALTAGFYTAMFGAFGAYLPFWPVWLEDWGLSASEVGVYLSAAVLMRVVAGLAVPVIADRLDQRRMIVVVLSGIGVLLFAWHLGIESKGALMLATLGTGAVVAGVGPLGEALGTAAAQRHGFAYARPRAVGSAAFMVANLAVGAGMAVWGADTALWWILVFTALTAVFGWWHPGGGHVDTKPPDMREIARLLTMPVFALFAAVSALINASHAVYYAYGSVHWRTLGFSESTIGGLWAVSVAVEIGFMLILGPMVVRRLGAIGALMLAGAAATVRWIWMMFDPGLVWLVLLQGMHSLTFACALLGSMAFIGAAVPDRYGGSAQGAHLGFAGGLLTAGVMALAAWLYPLSGGQSYAIGAVMSTLGVAIAIVLRRRWDGRMLEI